MKKRKQQLSAGSPYLKQQEEEIVAKMNRASASQQQANEKVQIAKSRFYDILMQKMVQQIEQFKELLNRSTDLVQKIKYFDSIGSVKFQINGSSEEEEPIYRAEGEIALIGPNLYLYENLFELNKFSFSLSQMDHKYDYHESEFMIKLTINI